MAHFRLTFVLIICVLLCSGTAVAQEQDVAKGGTISGHIKDTTPLESPINGVRVVFVNADGTEFETQTDAEGAYERAGLPAGRYLVSVYKPGYQDRIGKPVSVVKHGRHFVPLTMNKSKNIISAFLFGGKQGGVLRFSVHSRAKRAIPLEGIEIKITKNESVLTGISNAAGQYRSDRLPAGDYIVTVDKDDYHVVCPMTVHEDKITVAYINIPIADENLDFNILPARKSNRLHAENFLRGKIREMVPFETAVSDVEVVIRSVDGVVFRGKSNADGEYECMDLQAGRYLIDLSKKGYIDKKGIPVVIMNDGDQIAAVIEEGMFVSYAAVANGPLLELTHGMSRE